MAEKQLSICVDMDGTLLSYDKYEKNKFGLPKDDVVDKLKEMMNKGVQLILSTARGEDELEALKEHLDKHDLLDMFDDVRAGEKPPAIAYLDDKALNVLDEDWQDKLDAMFAMESEKD